MLLSVTHSDEYSYVFFLKNKMHADKCVESGELKLKGSVMEAMPALEKKALNKDRDKHPDKKKDNRNLYLVKEGGILAKFVKIFFHHSVYKI